MTDKIIKRNKRKAHSKMKMSGTSSVPRVSIFRSNKNIYIQALDDSTHKTLVSSDSLKNIARINKVELSKHVAISFYDKLSSLNISQIVFDRSGYKYHGRVKIIADTLREKGIKF